MKKVQKRVAAIHDISCFGKCSLTAALPIISAAGIETAVIPTAVLSTHTGGFSGYTFRDLTDDILPIARHWKQCGITVDAVYTGYLGSSRQTELVLQAIELIKKSNTLVIVDPVMADDGRLYGGFSPDFPLHMRSLCERADIITPNITEAALLLGVEFMSPPHTEKYIGRLLKGLYALTGSRIVLTGVSFNRQRIGVACFDGEKTEYVFSEHIDAAYPGTGDAFASALVAALMNGKSLNAASAIAVNFICDAIRLTQKRYPDMKYSVAFEEALPELIKILEPETLI